MSPVIAWLVLRDCEASLSSSSVRDMTRRSVDMTPFAAWRLGRWLAVGRRMPSGRLASRRSPSPSSESVARQLLGLIGSRLRRACR